MICNGVVIARMLDMMSTASHRGHGALIQYQDLDGVFNWLQAPNLDAHHLLASAQSMTSAVHSLEHAILPRALSAFPLARQASQLNASKCDNASEAPGECRSAKATDRPYSSGDRLQKLKRQQVHPLSKNLLAAAHQKMPLLCTAVVLHKSLPYWLHRSPSGPRVLL